MLVLTLTATLAVGDWLRVGDIEENLRAAEDKIEAYGALRDLQIHTLKVNLAIQKFVNTENRTPLEGVRREVQSLAAAIAVIDDNGRLDVMMGARSRAELQRAIAALRDAFDAVVRATDAQRIASDQTLATGAAAYGVAAGLFDRSLDAADLELSGLAGRVLFGVLNSRFLLARSEGPTRARRSFRRAGGTAKRRSMPFRRDIPVTAYHDEIGAMASALVKFRDDAVTARRLERDRIEDRANARLAEAVEVMNHGFGLYDCDDRMVLCNLLHRRWSADLARADDDRSTREIELADGTWIRLDQARTLSGHTVRVQTDVSALKQHAHELIAAKEAAEAANRVKSEFLANMSHELRTPLNAVIGFSEALHLGVAGPVTPRQLEYVRDIHASGSHLLEIVNDIPDLSKIAAGKLEITARPIDLLQVIAASVALVQGRANEAALRIKTEVPPDIPLLKADELRLKQILLNLLSNAIVADNSLFLSVTDTGIGMRPQDVATALEPLVKAMVELHGGELRIDSEPERGTCVTIRFANYLARPRAIAAA